MSNWQSFFNELTKPTKQKIYDSFASSHDLTICTCNKGSLSYCMKDVSYSPNGACSLTTTCCVIQIDKHKARGFQNSIINSSFDA